MLTMENSILVITICLQIHGCIMAGWPNCGADIYKRNPSTLPKIENVAGSESNSIQHPWSIVILRENNSVHCSGSVIAPTLVLTAGHCFAENNPNNDDFPKDKLKIAYGLDDLKNLDFEFIPKTFRNIKEVRFHPKYKWQAAYSDIVVVEVDKEVTFGSTIWPVCLPDRPNIEKDHLNMDSGTIVGFGPKDDNSKTMKQISQKIRSVAYCSKRYNPVNADFKLRSLLLTELPNGFDDTLICAQTSGFGSGPTCPGDSGGPLLTSVEDIETLETKAQQVGVLHGGLEACSNANFPAIYVRLDNPSIHQWLMSQISGTQTSKLPQQCKSYEVLDEADRNIKSGHENGYYCDDDSRSDLNHGDFKGPGWYRMMNPAGTKIPEVAPPTYRCGTWGTGWLNGAHPDGLGQTVSREVCFNFFGDKCSEKTTIKVTNCGGFYVYELPRTPGCPLRYCAE